MKKVFCLFILFVFGCLAVFFSDAYAGDGEALFKSQCGKCHGASGEAPAFSPVKYASSQWERFFKRNKHGRKKDISGQISGGDMDAIMQYLIGHAADSDLPVAAGLK